MNLLLNFLAYFHKIITQSWFSSIHTAQWAQCRRITWEHKKQTTVTRRRSRPILHSGKRFLMEQNMSDNRYLFWEWSKYSLSGSFLRWKTLASDNWNHFYTKGNLSIRDQSWRISFRRRRSLFSQLRRPAPDYRIGDKDDPQSFPVWSTDSFLFLSGWNSRTSARSIFTTNHYFSTCDQKIRKVIHIPIPFYPKTCFIIHAERG